MNPLNKDFDAVTMMRNDIFFQHSETGWGNYTQERHQWLGNPTVKTLAKDILQWRQNKLDKRVQ